MVLSGRELVDGGADDLQDLVELLVVAQEDELEVVCEEDLVVGELLVALDELGEGEVVLRVAEVLHHDLLDLEIGELEEPLGVLVDDHVLQLLDLFVPDLPVGGPGGGGEFCHALLDHLVYAFIGF